MFYECVIFVKNNVVGIEIKVLSWICKDKKDWFFKLWWKVIW